MLAPGNADGAHPRDAGRPEMRMRVGAVTQHGYVRPGAAAGCTVNSPERGYIRIVSGCSQIMALPNCSRPRR